jgi:hypothetical protein
MRKLSDIWNAIDDQRKMNVIAWKRSYEGIKTAIEYIGLTMITTKEELDKMEIPVSRSGKKAYGYRKIDVSRDGIISKSRINDILNGKNSLKTKEEMVVIHKKLGVYKNLVLPKGIATTHNSESKTVNDLDILIGISDYVHREHLVEFRLYDMAYCMMGDDINKEVFVVDQIKSSRENNNGRVTFNASSAPITIKTIVSILENGSLTFIGKNKDNIVDVVWFLYGNNIINILKNFNMTQTFQPILHLQVKSYNEFTNTMNDPMFRFDVGKSELECRRLLERKLEFIKNGPKKSLMFWNENESQIPSISNIIEHESFLMTKNACKNIDIKIERRYEDAYGPIDFIVNGKAKIQDKVGSINYSFRHYGRYPYNPDDFDIFQVSDIVNNIVYAIPMRIVKDNIVISFFTTEQLMKSTIRFGLKWKELHKIFKHDFKTNEGIVSYVKACEDASKISQLKNRSFYINMIDENKDKFGSSKQLKDRK